MAFAPLNGWFRVVFIVVVAIACLESPLTCAAPSPAKKNCTKKVAALGGQPDLTTSAGKIRFAISLLRRHAGLVTANLKFRRNILDVLSPVPGLRSELGAIAAPSDFGPPQVHQVRYNTVRTEYDTARIQAFVDDRRSDLKELPINRKYDLAGQLVAYKKSATKNGVFDGKLFRKLVSRLMRVSPFLYNDSGRLIQPLGRPKPVDHADFLLRGTKPEALDNLYFDLQAQHHQPIFQSLWSDHELKLGVLKEIYGSISNQLLGRDLKRALTPLSSDGKNAENRVLTLVSVPPEAALYRGCYGGDCSILSVPYYPLVKDVSVHYIFKSADHSGDPDGYIVSTLAEVKGKKLPYVITVNGALAAADVSAAVRILADANQSEKILLPNFEASPGNRFLVNTDEARRGLRADKSKVVEVKLPPGWEVIDQHLAKSTTKYTNYYHANNLKTAHLADVSALPTHFLNDPQHSIAERPFYAATGEIHQVPLRQRAIFAAQALEDQSYERGRMTKEELLSELGITEEQIEEAKRITEITADRPMTLAGYQKANQLLEFGFDDLMSLEVYARAFSLAELYAENPELFTPGQWRRATTQTLRALNAPVHGPAPTEEEAEELMQAKLALPGPAAVDAALPELLAMLTGDKIRTEARLVFQDAPEKFSAEGSKQFVQTYLKFWEQQFRNVRWHSDWKGALFEELRRMSLSANPIAEELAAILESPPTENGVPLWPQVRPWAEENLEMLYRRYGHERLRSVMGEFIFSPDPKLALRMMGAMENDPDLALSPTERWGLLRLYHENKDLGLENSAKLRDVVRLITKDFHPDTVAVMARALPRIEAKYYFERIQLLHPETVAALKAELSPEELAKVMARQTSTPDAETKRRITHGLSLPLKQPLERLKWGGSDSQKAGETFIRMLKSASVGSDEERAYDLLLHLTPEHFPESPYNEIFSAHGTFTREVIDLARQDRDPSLKQAALTYLLKTRLPGLSLSAKSYNVRSILLAGQSLWKSSSFADGIDYVGLVLRGHPEWLAGVAENLNDTNPRVRRNALRVLSYGPVPPAPVLATIQALTQDPYFEIQSVAHAALEKWGQSEPVPKR